MSETISNPEYHHAFKIGYRLALQKRTLSHMPSYIRKDEALRAQFEKGWQQARDEMSAGVHFNKTGFIRHRIGWVIMTAIAGLATGYYIIQLNETVMPTLSAPSWMQNPPKTPPAPVQPNPNPIDLSQMPESEFGLLTNQERLSLTGFDLSEDYPLIANTPEKLDPQIQGYLTHQQQPIAQGTTLNKSIRQLRFEVELNSQIYPEITIRWLWQNKQVKHSLHQPKPLQSLVSDITLYSALQGNWRIEVLDQQGYLVYLYEFNFVQP
jgi:hypothetical protein